MKTYKTFPVLCALFIFAKSVQSECGDLFGIVVQSLNDWSGEISSPGLEQGEYPHHQTCKWNVSIPSAGRIEITLHSSELEEAFGEICSDYLQITSGRRVVIKTCGLENTPKTFVLTSHSFMVEFVSDMSTTNRGFLLSYRGLCEFPLKANTDLYTPYYPQTMDHKISCMWTLKAENNTVNIKLLGLNGKLPECTTSPLYAKSGEKVVYLCTGKPEFTFHDLTYLYYKMKDHTVHWVGQIVIKFLIPPKCALADNMPLVMHDWSGVIDSPLTGDDLYPANQDCTWIVNIRSATGVMLTFVLFDLDRGKDNGTCLDYVKIKDAKTVLFEGCNEILLPHTVLSKTNRVEVSFHSNKNGSNIGFELTYSGVCGGNVEESFVLETPNYPNPPVSDVECQWQMGSAAQTTVMELVVERNEPTCNSFIVRVLSSFEGDTISDELCVKRPIMAHRQNLTLVYSYTSPHDDTVEHRWWGKLVVTISDTFKKEDCAKMCNISSGCTMKMTVKSHKYICICRDDKQSLGCDSEALCQAEACFKKNVATVLCPSDYGEDSSWSSTAAGLLDVQSCPKGASGESYRMCNVIHENQRLATWSTPDLTFCSSSGNTNLSDVKTFLEKAASSNGSTILEKLKEVANLSSYIESGISGSPRVYPGDLFFIADVLDQLAEYVESTPTVQTSFTGEYLKYNVWSMLMKIMKATSTYVRTLVMLNIVNEEFSLNGTSPNFYFQIVELRDALNFTIGDIDISLPNSSQILVPKSGKRLRLFFMSFQHLAGYLQYMQMSSEDEDDIVQPMTDIVSFEAVDESDFNGALEDPIGIVFHLQDDDVEVSEKKTLLCAELHLPPSSPVYTWNVDGCHTLRVSAQLVRCHCLNMTVLAVVRTSRVTTNMVMSKEDGGSTRFFREMHIACIFTFLLCLLTCRTKKNLSPDQWFVLWHQIVSLTLLQISYMLIWTLGQFEQMQDYACYGLAALLHYSVTVVGIWMFVNAVYIYLEALKKEYKRAQLAFKLLSYGFPILLILTGVTVFETSYYSPPICWVDQKVMWSFVVPPFILLLALSLFIYFYVGFVLTKVKDKEGHTVTLHANYWMGVLVCLSYYLAWTFAFICLYMSGITILHVTAQILFSVFNSCTGVLLFLNYSICSIKSLQGKEPEVIPVESPLPPEEIEPANPSYYYEEENHTPMPADHRAYQRNPDYTWTPVLEEDELEKHSMGRPVQRSHDFPSTDKDLPRTFESQPSLSRLMLKRPEQSISPFSDTEEGHKSMSARDRFFRKKPERSWAPSPMEDETMKSTPPVGRPSPQKPERSWTPSTDKRMSWKSMPSMSKYFKKKPDPSKTPDVDEQRQPMPDARKPSERNPLDSWTSSVDSITP